MYARLYVVRVASLLVGDVLLDVYWLVGSLYYIRNVLLFGVSCRHSRRSLVSYACYIVIVSWPYFLWRGVRGGSSCYSVSGRLDFYFCRGQARWLGCGDNVARGC